MTKILLDAWLDIIARDGWAAARIDAVAASAGATTAEVADAYPDRWTALRGYQEALDRAVLAEAGSDRDASVRDRLFALLMAGFDAAEARKPAVRRLVEASRLDPGLAAFAVATLPASIARTAAAAGVDTGGWTGPWRVAALTLVVAQVSRTWLDDDDPELASTMKALDAGLARAERWARRSVRGSPATPGSADDLPAG